MPLTDNECINLRSALYDCFSNKDNWNNFFKDDKLNLEIDISNYPKKEDLDKIKSQYTEIKILIFEAPELNLSLNQEYESIISSIKSSSHGNSFTIIRERVISADEISQHIAHKKPDIVHFSTSLAYAIAHELKLDSVLTWSITSRSTLQDELYRYDAIGRLQDAEKKEDQSIGDYITLGALGTAFLPSSLPRVLLIDEIDKSDINLPNDLLHIFEEGGFNIPELVRRVTPEMPENQRLDRKREETPDDILHEEGRKKTEPEKKTDTAEVYVYTSDGEIKAKVRRGRVRCAAFPIVIMTSNGEREFPPAFLRRCLRVKMPAPQAQALKSIVKAHFGEEEFNRVETDISQLIGEFLIEGDRATDQLLNIIHLLTNHISLETLDKDGLKKLLFKSLSFSDEP